MKIFIIVLAFAAFTSTPAFAGCTLYKGKLICCNPEGTFCW
jgi:hypothetical protein